MLKYKQMRSAISMLPKEDKLFKFQVYLMTTDEFQTECNAEWRTIKESYDKDYLVSITNKIKEAYGNGNFRIISN